MSESRKSPDHSWLEGVTLVCLMVVIVGLFSIPTVLYFSNRSEDTQDWKSRASSLYTLLENFGESSMNYTLDEQVMLTVYRYRNWEFAPSLLVNRGHDNIMYLPCCCMLHLAWSLTCCMLHLAWSLTAWCGCSYTSVNYNVPSMNAWLCRWENRVTWE